MTRGNQREKAREKNLATKSQEKKKNTMSGSEFRRAQEATAEIMRQKQAKALAEKGTGGESAGGSSKGKK